VPDRSQFYMPTYTKKRLVAPAIWAVLLSDGVELGG
jgi:hypothetical protein